MQWDIKIARRVFKQMKQISKKDVQRLFLVLRSLPQNPYSGDIEKLEGEENVWRRRVGVWRIIYEIFPKQKFIFIEDIWRRTDTTYKR